MRRAIINRFLITSCLLYLNIVGLTAQAKSAGQIIEIERNTHKPDGATEKQIIKIFKANDGTIGEVTLDGQVLPKESGTYKLIVSHYIGTVGQPGTIQVNEEVEEFTEKSGETHQKIKMTYGITSYAEELMTAEEKGGFLSDKLRKEMIKDGLVSGNSASVSIVLTNKNMTINGVNQETSIANKYRTLYEQHTGSEIAGDDNIELFLVTNKRSY